MSFLEDYDMSISEFTKSGNLDPSLNANEMIKNIEEKINKIHYLIENRVIFYSNFLFNFNI